MYNIIISGLTHVTNQKENNVFGGKRIYLIDLNISAISLAHLFMYLLILLALTMGIQSRLGITKPSSNLSSGNQGKRTENREYLVHQFHFGRSGNLVYKSQQKNKISETKQT